MKEEAIEGPEARVDFREEIGRGRASQGEAQIFLKAQAGSKLTPGG